MISRYKQIGGDGKYDDMYHSLCKAMNRRIRQSPYLNCKTYPGELVYIPDMLVAIVALYNYSCQYDGEYSTTVNMWIERAMKEWIDKEYEDGRQTTLSTEEIEQKIEEFSNGEFKGGN